MEKHNKKRMVFRSITAVFLAVLLVLSPMAVVAAGGENKTGGTTGKLGDSVSESSDSLKESDDRDSDKKTPENEGEEAPLIEVNISTEEELRSFASRVNGGDSMKGHLVKLTKNININKDNPWVPIGKDALTPFSGVFDGQGYVVSGFHVDPQQEGGLFGFLLNATVKNLTADSFVANKSTAGIFFSASGTTVEMSRGKQKGAVMMAYASPFSAPDSWDGTTDMGWDQGGPTYIINTAEELAGVAEEVRENYREFFGETFVLTRDLDMTGGDWVPIGEAWATEFAGRFIGQGHTIYGLNQPLFDVVTLAEISDLNIVGADIFFDNKGYEMYSTSFGSGILANTSYGSEISRIHIKDCKLTAINVDDGSNASGTGGVVGSIANYVETPSTVSKVLVENTHISSDWRVGGVVGDGNGVITECTVYGGSLERTVYDTSLIDCRNAVGGIASQLVGTLNMNSMKDCLVMGTEFKNSYYTAGITWSANFGAVVSDAVVSDISFNVSQSDDSKTYIGVGPASFVMGSQRVFTDSDLDFRFVPDPVTYVDADGISDYYWDNITHHQDHPISGKNNNEGLSTSTLTDGVWIPSEGGWKSTKNFYPQLQPLANYSWNEFVPVISATAAIAPVPENVDENYKIGVSKLFLPTAISVDTPTGKAPLEIKWEGYKSLVPSKIKAENVSGGIVLSAVGDTVSGIDLTASIEGYEKSFKDVKLVDNRLDYSHSVPKQNDIVDADDDITFTAVFNEKIAENPLAAAKLASLKVKRGSEYITLEVIPLDSAASTKYSVSQNSANKWEMKFVLSELQPGNDYQMVIPSGAVHADGNEKALSEDIVVDFSTAELGKPIISFEKDLWFPIEQSIGESDIIANLRVKDFDGTVMYNGTSSSTVTPQRYTGSLWNSGNTDGSIRDILDSMSNNSISYVILDDTVFDNSLREAGPYEVFFLAKNKKGEGSSRLMLFAIKGKPEWLETPDPVVHIQWTNDKRAVEDAAGQSTVAQIKQKDGKSIPCPVIVEISEKDWEQSLLLKEGPSTIKAKIVATDPSDITIRKEADVVVYLDRPLYWVMTPSPVTMNITTKSKVEERMNVIPMNFSSKILKYDHWENDYRKPGLYYIDISSDPQHTTDCNDANCPYKEHPSNVVDDTLILNVRQTPGAEINNFWGNAAAQLEKTVGDDSSKETSYIYSKNVVQVSPKSYRLPSFVLDGMKKQAYGRMEVNFGNYRWNLYSNTLDTKKKWSDEYNLETKLSAVNTKDKNAVQIEFTETGILFGTVEFDINLENVATIAPNLKAENLGLYRYDSENNKLILVSNVIVKDDKWASALIKEIYPGSYILKEKAQGDVVVEVSPKKLQELYLSTKIIDTKTGTIKDGDTTKLSLPTDREQLTKLLAGGQLSATGEILVGENIAPDDKASSSSGVMSTVLKAAAVVIGLSGIVAAGFYIYKRKESK